MFPDFTKSKYNEVNMNNSNDDFNVTAWGIGIFLIIVFAFGGYWLVQNNNQKLADEKAANISRQETSKVLEAQRNYIRANEAANEDFQKWCASWSAKANGKFGYDPLANVPLRSTNEIYASINECNNRIDLAYRIYASTVREIRDSYGNRITVHNPAAYIQYEAVRDRENANIELCNLEFKRLDHIYNHTSPFGF